MSLTDAWLRVLTQRTFVILRRRGLLVGQEMNALVAEVDTADYISPERVEEISARILELCRTGRALP